MAILKQFQKGLKKLRKILIFSILLFTFLVIFFLNNCGIEDSLVYFREPRNLHYESDGFLYFYGFNQEKDGDQNLFVGYDIYYYFNDSNNAKKAMVRNPNTDSDVTGDHSPLHDFRSDPRFPSSNFSSTYLRDIYQYVTFPVTDNMINDVLEEGNNDNVRICFHNSELVANTEYNPKQNSSSYIIMEELFPNYSEYNGKTWAVDQTGNHFRGFLDQDYYDYKGISGSSGSGYKEYDIYIYVLAKGFNSNTEKNTDYTESLKSSVIKIRLRADDSTNNFVN